MKNVVIGFLGVNLDMGRKRRWRPTISLATHDHFKIDRLEILHDLEFNRLAHQVKREIEMASPGTEVLLQRLELDDPWDFQEVYGKLFDFARNYGFDEDRERYHVHLTTGTHVAQICWFLLTESRHIPARLVQTGPPGRGQDRSSLDVIDLDLSRYNALQQRFDQLSREYSDQLKGGIETRNAAYNALIDRIELVASNSDAPILLLGETGTGKEMFARAIHASSPRRQGPFETVDCGALLPSLVVSELFGHEPGAFTGANHQHVGAFERAHGGTLFLDEVGELSPQLQPVLLGAIERRSFRRVGGSKPVSVDVRVISATNRDLREAVNARSFREDLFFRLGVVTLNLPPLRERPNDIPMLAEFFAHEAGWAGSLNELLKPEEQERLVRYRWPGNVRELRNFVEAALAMGEAPALAESASSDAPTSSGSGYSSLSLERLLSCSYKDARAMILDEFEQLYLEAILERTEGNVSRAAREAQMNRSYLVDLLKRKGLR